MQGGEGSGPGSTGLGGCPRNEAHSAANPDWARLEAVFMNYEKTPTPFPQVYSLPRRRPLGRMSAGPLYAAPGTLSSEVKSGAQVRSTAQQGLVGHAHLESQAVHDAFDPLPIARIGLQP